MKGGPRAPNGGRRLAGTPRFGHNTATPHEPTDIGPNVSEERKEEARGVAPPGDRYPHYADDEISLVDLWLMLARRKGLMLGVLALFALGGATMALLQTETYTYTTSVQIGRGISGYEGNNATQAKLENAFIPDAMQSIEEDPPEVTASIPEGSDLVILKSQGPASEEERHTAIHADISSALVAHHRPILEKVEQSLQAQIRDARNELQALKAEEDPSMIEILQREATLDRLETRLDTLEPTRAFSKTHRSRQPTGTSGTLILALSLVLGGMVAVFAALFREFLATVAKQQAARETQ